MKSYYLKKSVSSLIPLMLVLSMAACSSGNTKPSKSRGTSGSVRRIGIVQLVEHPSLNTIRGSIIKELGEKGFKDGDNIIIDYQNAQNDQTNLKTICHKFASSRVDMIIAIATPSAQAAAGETRDIPVLFSAVTDPVGAGLVSDLKRPDKNVTGTSDAVSAEKIMELAKRITPDIKRIGVLYNSGETNSVSVVKNLREYAKGNGMNVVEATVTNSSEVQQAVQSLTGKVDAIFLPIDNTVASAMPVVTKVANQEKIPVYVGADSMVKDGALAICGINYEQLGKETGDMAADILNGKRISDMPVRIMTDMDIYLNKNTANQIGVKIPEDVLNVAIKVY